MTRRRLALALALIVLFMARLIAEWRLREDEPYLPFADGFESGERLAAGLWDRAGGSEVA